MFSAIYQLGNLLKSQLGENSVHFYRTKMYNATSPTSRTNASTIFIANIAAICMLVNIFYFSLGLKTLKKKAHNMFVISMCCGDFLYGVSLCLLCLINMFRQILFELCFGQIIVYFLSMNTSLTIVFLICIERYATIKAKHFGIFEKAEEWKKKTAAGMLIFSTLFVMVSFLATPRATTTITSMECYMDNFYTNSDLEVLMGLLSALFGFFLLSIVVVYSLILRHLFTFIYKRRQISHKRSLKSLNSDKKDIELKQVRRAQKVEDIQQAKEVDPVRSFSSISHIVCRFDLVRDFAADAFSRSSANPENDKESVVDNNASNRNNFHRDNGDDNEIMEINSVLPVKAHVKRHISNDKLTPDNIEKVSGQVIIETRQRSELTKWEIQAVVTTGFIIVTTVCLFGPVTYCLMARSFGKTLPKMIGNIAALLVALQCVINPFIYVMRFKELRIAIKNIFRCRRHYSEST